MSATSWLASMNLARWIMVLGGLGSVALAANGWRLMNERERLEAALRPDGLVERTSSNIQNLGKLCSKLQADADREGLSGAQAEPSVYFRDLAKDDKVRLGQVDIKTPTSQEVYPGTRDLTYQLQPQTDRGAARDKIFNYMYLLEQRSRRVKVTQIRLTPEQRLEPGDTGNDMWKWEIELTSRTKVDGAPQRP
jgi:hypothetical protein